MANMNSSDINSMRQDAIRRVNEMQRHSQNLINKSNLSIKSEVPLKNSPQPNMAKNTQKNPQAQGSFRPQNKNVNNINNEIQQNFQNNPRQHNSGMPFFGTPFRNSNAKPQNLHPEQKKEEKSQQTSASNSTMAENKENISSKNPLGGILDKIFPNFKLDDDKVIIILLLIVLSREGADLKLLIALGYLLI